MLMIFSGNNCQLPRSRPYVSFLMEFPSVPRSNNNNNNNGHSNNKFWSSIASHSPGRPQPLLNGHHHHNGHAHQHPGNCALYACAVSCVRAVAASARDCVSSGQSAPSRVYGISSDTLSSDNRFQEDCGRPSAPPNSQAPRESPPYLPSEPRRHLNGHHGNGIGTVRDLPV